MFEKAIASAKANGKDALAADRLPVADFVGNGGKYRVMVLGFGKTGQLALNALFSDTAYLDEDGVQPGFAADIYDNAAQVGLFSSEHPMYLCASANERYAPMSEEEFADKTKCQSEKIEEAFAPIAAEGYAMDDIVKKTRLPRLVFHEVSCFELGFFDELDRQTEKSGKNVSRKLEYNAYVIALGDDESNIAMANALLDDFKHEKNADGGSGNVIVYVNVRDRRNRCRIGWSEDDVARSGGHINVVLFGDASDMYTYRNIVDIEDDKKFNYAYQLLGGYTKYDGKDKKIGEVTVHNKFEADIAKIFADFGKPNAAGEDFEKKVKDVVALLAERIGADPDESEQKWMECSMMDRESNYGARRFGRLLALIIDAKPVDDKLLMRLSEIEHIRWMRLMMAYGWIYSGKKDKEIKEHDNLCPFEMLPIDDSVTKSRVAIAKGETDEDAVKKPAGKGPHYGRVHANDTINVLLAALLYGKKGKEGDL